MQPRVFLIQTDSIGQGDKQLGTLLMANFLRLLGESNDKPEALVFLNDGVRLVCQGSPMLDYLKRLESQGIQLLACTTCLEYLDLVDKLEVGQVGTMAKTIQLMMSSLVISL